MVNRAPKAFIDDFFIQFPIHFAAKAILMAAPRRTFEVQTQKGKRERIRKYYEYEFFSLIRPQASLLILQGLQ
jgi:hypothetical protein